MNSETTTNDSRAADFLRPLSPKTASGLALRPLSSGSYALLVQTHNAFITPPEDGQKADHLVAALEYAFIHAAPLELVLRAAYSDPEVFRAEVFRFSHNIPVQDLPGIIKEMETCLTLAAGQSVDVLSRPGSEDKDAPPNS
jgi:hypothetical protein